MAKRLKRIVGDVLKIELGDGTHSYAQVSSDPLVIFYDLKTAAALPMAEIVKLPVAFKMWVLNADLKKGVREKIGNAPVDLENLSQPMMFKQDRVDGRLALHHGSFADTNYEREATLAACRGLERAAVWEAAHVEDRLRDHFKGVENQWVRSMAIEEDKVPDDQR